MCKVEGVKLKVTAGAKGLGLRLLYTMCAFLVYCPTVDCQLSTSPHITIEPPFPFIAIYQIQ